jgi:hypothetical protein
MSSKKSASNNKKVAVITIGRMQPPHKGHDVLIRDTVQLARNLGGVPYVWISPSRTDGRSGLEEGKVPERTENDPLSISQRFYYLNKMYPNDVYSDVKFLYDMDEDIRLKTQKELNAGTSTLENQRRRQELPNNWKNMTFCQKYKYASIMENQKAYFLRVIRVRDRAARVSVGGRRLPSKQCLNWLKSRRFKEVILLVGSDRVNAFKKYNQDLGEDLFKNFKVSQSGHDRGDAGKQELKNPIEIKRDLSVEGIDDLSKMMSGLSISPAEQKERALEYSGTRTRKAAITGNIVEFVRSVKEGNMTMMDCFCLYNDVRTRGIPSSTPNMRVNQTDFLDKLTQQEKSEFYKEKNKIESFGSKMIRLGRTDPTYMCQSKEDDDKYGVAYNPFAVSDFLFDGGRRRKTRKKKRKKNRKKTRKKRGGGKKTRRKKKKRETRKKKKRKTRKKRGGVYTGQIPPPIGTIIKRRGSNSFLRVTGYSTNLRIRAKPISNSNSPVIFISNSNLLDYYIHISEPNPQSSN